MNAEKAIALDPLLPEAYATQGLVGASDLNWPLAEKWYRKALDLNPNLAYVREDFALFVLLPEGRIDEAVQQSRRAVELDPLTPARRVMLSFILLSAGKFEEAQKIAGAVYFANSRELFAGQNYCRALILQGHLTEAIKLLENLGPGSYGVLGYAYAKSGNREKAQALANTNDPAVSRHRVLIYAGLGDKDRCFEALQVVASDHDGLADVYPSYPELAWLKNAPRMKAFRQSRNLN